EQRLAGDVGGVVRAQERHRRGHLLGAARPPHRDVLFYHVPLDRVVDPGAVDRRDGRARTYPVDPDAAPGILQRPRPGEVLHAALGHRVAEEPRLGYQLVDAGYVDDHAGPFGTKEAAHRLTGTQERAPQVNGEDLVEVGGRQLVGVRGDLDPRVVDQDVQPSVLAHHLVVHRAHGLL